MQGVENQVQYSISVSLIRNILRPLLIHLVMIRSYFQINDNFHAIFIKFPEAHSFICLS